MVIKEYKWWQRALITQTNIVWAMFHPEAKVEAHKKKHSSALDYNIELRIIPQLNNRLTDIEKFEWFLTREEQIKWLNDVAQQFEIKHLSDYLKSPDTIDPVSLYKTFIEGYHEGQTSIKLTPESLSWTKLNDVLTPLKGLEITATDATYSHEHALVVEKVLSVLLALNGNPNLKAGELYVVTSRDLEGKISYKLHNGFGIETINQLSCFMSHLFRKMPEDEQLKQADYTAKRLVLRTPEGFESKLWVGAGVYLMATGTLTIDHPELISRRASTKPCNVTYRVPPEYPVYREDGLEFKDSVSRVRVKYIFGQLENITAILKPKNIWHALLEHYEHFSAGSKLDDHRAVFGMWAGKPLAIYNLFHSLTHIAIEVGGVFVGAAAASLAYMNALTGHFIYTYLEEAGYEPEKYGKKLIDLVEKVTNHSFSESKAKDLSRAELIYQERLKAGNHATILATSPMLPSAVGTGVYIPKQIIETLLDPEKAKNIARQFVDETLKQIPYVIQNSLPYRLQSDEQLMSSIKEYLYVYTTYHSMEAAARSQRREDSKFASNHPLHDEISVMYNRERAMFTKLASEKARNDDKQTAQIEDIVEDIFKNNFGIFLSRHCKNLEQRATLAA